MTAGEALGATGAAAPPNAAKLTHLSIPRRARPERLVPLVGRGTELREVEEAFTHSYLVTIVGIAGVAYLGSPRGAGTGVRTSQRRGRLGLLSALARSEHVPSAIAVALGLSLPDEVEGFCGSR